MTVRLLLCLALPLHACGSEAPGSASLLDAATATEPADIEGTDERREQAQTTLTRQSGLWVNPFDWAPWEGESDPFGDVPNAPCVPEAHGSEEVTGIWVYSIETEACSWLTLSQETALEALEGDRVVARIFHFALLAPEAASARVGLALSDQVLASTEIPIPSSSGVVTLEHVLNQPIPKGSDLLFHVDNHGANSWHLLEVRLNPEE